MSNYPHPVFGFAPHLGFDTGTDAADQSRFVLTRDDAKPVDWQGGVDVVADRIPGSGRVLRQDMGPRELTLTTGVMFADRQAFHRFWVNQRQTGTLRMNRDWTIWPADRERTWGGVTYAEWDDVTVEAISGVTVDRRGVVHCVVTFARGDTSWS